MTHCILIVPTGYNHGAASVAEGVKHIFDREGISTGLHRPISMKANHHHDHSMPLRKLTRFMSEGKLNEALEASVENYQTFIKQNKPDVVVVLGLKLRHNTQYADDFNSGLAQSLNAKIILVGTHTGDDLDELRQRGEFAARRFGGSRGDRILGTVLNRWGIPRDKAGRPRPDLLHAPLTTMPSTEAVNEAIASISHKVPLLGLIPWNRQLISMRVSDLAEAFETEYLFKGEANRRRIKDIVVGARLPSNMDSLTTDAFILTSGDRDDIILAAAMSEMAGRPVAGILLTSGLKPSPRIISLIQPAIDNGLPILVTNQQTYDVATAVSDHTSVIPQDDIERKEAIANYMADNLDKDRLLSVVKNDVDRRLSPAAFRYSLVTKAIQAKKRIVLPEGEEPRTIQAAISCATRGLATPVLLGDEGRIREIATASQLTIPENLVILAPEEHRAQYIDDLVELRKHKGMNEVRAASLLEDNIVLATMMLAKDDVDGLVAGAINTTAATILPALQLIKTKPTTKLVSSCFFMCLPEQVVVYADCAVNPDPSAEELADIAIQTAESAIAFGIPAKVAMISYSTGQSGTGVDVDKVRAATKIAKELRPDLDIDGPLQFDAATTPSVALKKAPNSDVAGQATVLIFPDLNTGNTTYKAVQRSANVVSIGPMLQGMNKPVNDLSRGAMVDDIIYTIALTAIQADN